MVAIFLSIFGSFSTSLMAQVDTGSITGIVQDATGAVIQNAIVKVENAGTGTTISLVTNRDGLYSAPARKAGIYRVSASAPGFSPVTKSGIEVRVQDRVALDFQLQVGETSNSVSVESSVSALETETSSLGHVVEEKTIKNLPLNGRNYIQLATLAAGTSPAQNSNERNTFIANGERSIQNSYLLDGIDNKNKIVGFDNSSAQSIEPVLDSVQEFKVQTSTFSAEFGQSAGAVVNVTTKSGTNQFHGSAFEFLRNSFFDASPYFQPANTSNPQFIQNQFGATLGGPIIKDRTFFFFGWQSSREVNAAPQLASVPTDAQKDGQFTTPVYDPATTAANPNGTGYVRNAFAGNQIPASRYDPVSLKLLALYPEPNLSGKNNFFSNQRENVDNDQFVGRLDHRFGDKNSMFGRYSTSANTNILPATLPPPSSLPSIVTPEAHSFAASETHIFTPTLLNEARIGYQETRETQNINGQRLFDQYGIIGAPEFPRFSDCLHSR